MDLTENEESVYCLGAVWELRSRFETLTEYDDDPKVQEMWDYVRKDRASVRAARAGEQ